MIIDYFSIDQSLKGKYIPYDALSPDIKKAYIDSKMNAIGSIPSQNLNTDWDEICERIYCGGDEIEDIINELKSDDKTYWRGLD